MGEGVVDGILFPKLKYSFLIYILDTNRLIANSFRIQDVMALEYWNISIGGISERN